ncbi:carbohydrate ABC transporter permease [Clostridium sediminicola]|uniref:carbohydrate ABC transporter permease n=1 Tax=Clostridium sediminicola TaxID=3114879 RepID=UPI0031F25230
MKNTKNPMLLIIGAIIAFFHFIPLYILSIVAFKTPSDLSSRWLPPKYLTFKNFRLVLEDGNVIKALMNTTFITLCSIILVIIIASMASYPLSRIQNRTSMILVNIVLAVMMIPSLSVIVPLYGIMMKINAINTYWGIILVLVTYNLPMSIFLFTNFIKSIPIELDEAAAIDGCNPVKTFYSIIMPQLLPVTASVTILSGIKIWNDYRFALYFLQKPKYETLTLFISKYFSDFASNLNAAAAAALMAILPVILVFLFLQKYFVSGVSDGAIK